MATTKRTAVIEIQVDDKSLSQLNAEINELESSMQDLKVGTEEWIAANSRLGELKRNFSEVTAEASKLQGQVEKIGTDQQIRSVSELGKSMVGAFAGVTGVMSLLGATGNKTLDELTARGVQLLQVMTGLDAISKLFEKNTIDGLKAVGQGFGRLLTTVRTSSTGMKVALASTGIGAVVVAVGLLAANWDKVKNAVSGARREAKRAQEELDAEIAAQERNLNTQKEVNNLLIETLEIQKRQAQQRGDLRRELELENEILQIRQMQLIREDDNRDKSIKAKTDELKQLAEEINLLESKNRLNNEEKKNLNEFKIKYDEIANELAKLNAEQRKYNEEFNELINQSDVLNRKESIIGEINLLNEKNTLLENELSLLSAIEGSETQRAAKEREINNNKIKMLQLEALLQGKISEDAREQIKDIDRLINELKTYLLDPEVVGQGRINVEEEINELTEKRNNILFSSLETTSNLTEEQQQQILSIQGQNEAISLQERLRRQALLSQIELINNEREYEALINACNNSLQEQTIELEKQNTLLGISNDEYESQLEVLNVKYEDILTYEKEIEQTIEERFRGLQNQSNVLRQQIDYYNQKGNLERDILLNEQQSVQNQKTLAEAQIVELFNLNSVLDLRKQNLETRLNELKLDLSTETNLDKRLELTAQIQSTEQTLIGVNESISANKKTIADLDNDILQYNADILNTNKQINQSYEEQEKNINKITKQLSYLENVFVQLNDFITEFGEELSASRDLILAMGDLGSSIAERNAEMTQRRIDNISEQIDLLNQKEELHRENLLRYEKELQDANGQRYDELLAYMNQEQMLADQANQEKLNAEKELEKQEKKRLEFERKAAAWRKSQAIADSIIQTILATIEALPNVVLSAIVGATGAIGTASIIAQPLPQKPVAEKGMLVGSRHNQGGIDIEAEDGEFIVNRYAVAKYYPIIKAMNDDGRRNMASGGDVGRPDLNMGNTQFINYDLLASKIAEANSKLPNPVVSVMKIQSELSNVAVTKSNAGLRRS